MNEDVLFENPSQKRLLIWSAWSSILLVSDLPDIICDAVLGQVPGWLFVAKVGFLVLFFALCFLWKTIRPLLSFAFVMLVFYAALAASEWVRTLAWWQGLVSDTEQSFLLGYLRPYVRDIAVTLVVIAALWTVKRRRSEFFLVRGQTDAPIEPIRWLGIRQGESWRQFGWVFALAAALLVAVPTLLASSPSPDLLLRAALWLPAVLLFSAINAFNEEMYFRATLLSTLPQVIGKNHALLINVAFFGLAHVLYGSPPGLIGFLMTGFLAWLLGKSMLETKGLFWPWFIHFLPDVVIFFSYAIVWVQR
ncbi:CPBP family intramembrane metalloprotease [bacterium]|nr:CPBP family intramembrane metalloprotease [bacterium]